MAFIGSHYFVLHPKLDGLVCGRYSRMSERSGMKQILTDLSRNVSPPKRVPPKRIVGVP